MMQILHWRVRLPIGARGMRKQEDSQQMQPVEGKVL